MSVITIERKVLEKNDAVAGANRADLTARGLFTINLVSSPGAGKTSLLEKTLEYLKGRVRVGVIEGDVRTDLDARRIARLGAPAVQIVTNGGCHLEAALVRDAMTKLPLDALDILVIENVGNLVCPANYDLGEDMKVVVASTTEGDDKPLKYPEMFVRASALVVNKIDLLPYLPCDVDLLERNARSVNRDLEIFRTSCTTGEGIAAWGDWLAGKARRP
jgi:hydrogenase nickel incorporation protein HypB